MVVVPRPAGRVEADLRTRDTVGTVRVRPQQGTSRSLWGAVGPERVALRRLPRRVVRREGLPRPEPVARRLPPVGVEEEEEGREG